MNIEEELTAANRGERRWRAKLVKMDTGSYCESESTEAKGARAILVAYRQLADAVLAHERNGYQ